MNNLNDFRSQVNLYFDKGLDMQAEQQMMDQVDSDPKLNQVFNKEKNLRNLIKCNFQRTCVSPELIQNIKKQISIH